ncbi:hypothetical protein CRUP_015511, partial [Coryphaenoides rupestris]
MLQFNASHLFTVTSEYTGLSITVMDSMCEGGGSYMEPDDGEMAVRDILQVVSQGEVVPAEGESTVVGGAIVVECRKDPKKGHGYFLLAMATCSWCRK